jgi:hypothetical protein
VGEKWQNKLLGRRAIEGGRVKGMRVELRILMVKLIVSKK